MRNNKHFELLSFAIASILVFIMGFVTIATFLASEQDQGVFALAARYHLAIMLVTMLMFLAYGFFWSQFIINLYRKEEKRSSSLFNIVLKFLSKEEQLVLTYLVDERGRGTQSAISRINNMGGVKALRTVQKLEQKGVIQIQKEGKLRKIILNNSVLELLKNKKVD